MQHYLALCMIVIHSMQNYPFLAEENFYELYVDFINLRTKLSENLICGNDQIIYGLIIYNAFSSGSLVIGINHALK